MIESNLIRLIYVSQNLILGSRDEVVASVEQILVASRQRNAEASITGALMFNDGCFAQVLEGPEDAVIATHERILADPRHAKVVMIAEQPVEARQFGGWDMAFVGASTEASERFSSVLNDEAVSPETIDGDWVFDLVVDHLYSAEHANDAPTAI
ncbi:MAG: BLUF domain-containing protein [Acidimicrobiales bacterium]